MVDEEFKLTKAFPEINYFVWNAKLHLSSGHLFAMVVANGTSDGLTSMQNETLQKLKSLPLRISPEVESSSVRIITIFAHGHFDVDLITGEKLYFSPSCNRLSPEEAAET